MKIVRISPELDIKTEPMSPSKPVHFAAPKPENYEDENDSEGELDVLSHSETDSDGELDVLSHSEWESDDESRHSSDSESECFNDCDDQCELPPPCLRYLPYVKVENVCRHCGQRFPNEARRQLHEILHMYTCDCGNFHYKTFEELHQHLPDCTFMPVFRCEWNDLGCPYQFREIRKMFHHSALCLYKIEDLRSQLGENPRKRQKTQ